MSGISVSWPTKSCPAHLSCRLAFRHSPRTVSLSSIPACARLPRVAVLGCSRVGVTVLWLGGWLPITRCLAQIAGAA
ncbi:Uncharacterised protein [Mycobacterium tuberculosis]|nr:Uncharacterised protein [Mycobacterium tuberculosis]CKT37750.1 Uncharacterised protein [Mycobacterium tuberculosis]